MGLAEGGYSLLTLGLIKQSSPGRYEAFESESNVALAGATSPSWMVVVSCSVFKSVAHSCFGCVSTRVLRAHKLKEVLH